MAGKEVDRSVGSVLGVVNVPGACNTLSSNPPHTVIPFQKIAQIIPVPAVPLRPAIPGRKGSHLIQPARIPGLGNQLHTPQNRIKGKALQKRGLTHGGAVLIPSKDSCKIETETVHVIGCGPVTQTLQNHLMDNGMVTV